MMKEIYNYNNERFSMLRDPMRKVIGAFGNAEKWFATLKECALIEAGMPFLSDAIHKLEHIQPEMVDEFAAAFRPWHLQVEYPATNELIEEIDDLDRFFEICVSILEQTNNALLEMQRTASGTEFHSIALTAEELMIQNNALKNKLLQAWAMWDYNSTASTASFDKFVKSLFGDC